MLLTATQVRERVANIIFARPQIRHLDQFVPTLPSDEVKKSKYKSSVNRVSLYCYFLLNVSKIKTINRKL